MCWQSLSPNVLFFAVPGVQKALTVSHDITTTHPRAIPSLTESPGKVMKCGNYSQLFGQVKDFVFGFQNESSKLYE
jgi:hypothetical protein